MRYLLSRDSRAVVTRLAHERTLCAFDFDGTLSPIVEHPDRAGMRLRTRRLLRSLAALYPCIVVSGRARADVIGKLSGANVVRVIGNHGAETETTPNIQQVQQWKAVLAAELGLLPGMWVEDKGLSLTVHYRQSKQKKEARRRILAAARKLNHVHIVGGKQVVNLVLNTAPDKGDALADERARLGCNWVLYVGDDETDEDAFLLDGNVVSVRIGRKQRSHARYYLRAQPEIDELIELLVTLRKPLPPVSLFRESVIPG
jgi:trehalose 6-phosphate phosphatase